MKIINVKVFKIYLNPCMIQNEQKQLSTLSFHPLFLFLVDK